MLLPAHLEPELFASTGGVNKTTILIQSGVVCGEQSRSDVVKHASPNVYM